MIKKVILYAFGFVALAAAGCTSSKESTHDENAHGKEASAKSDNWDEMDEFHVVMAESFHPYKDSANLEPAKNQAGQMAAIAGKWAGAELPEKVNNEEVKAKLEKLKTDTEAFAATVKSADDKTIGESLTQLHNLFHEIQESWYSAEGHEEHVHHH